MSVAISIKKVSKKYDDTEVIHDLSVEISNGEFYTLLGPSGCGKTTLLRMIAGFADVESGEIAFDGKAINNLPAHKRNIGMVFQNYAIFPHLTVRENVEYGLKLRNVNKAELKKRVDEMLDVVQISNFAGRLPQDLSGGQQQRVALARAIVIHPNVLLMDEPLSNLDAKLRLEMRAAIREIQKKVGITTVYVTHDQEEALAISDRIAVMNGGAILQTGEPEQIYARPYNKFAAAFIGRSNFIDGRLTPDGNGYILSLGENSSIYMGNLVQGLGQRDVLVSIRPEEFLLNREGGIRFKVVNKMFLGNHINYELEGAAGGIRIEWSRETGGKTFNCGDMVTLKPDTERINLFTCGGERSLMREVCENG